MKQLCIFDAHMSRSYSVELGVLDSQGHQCEAQVSTVDGVFAHRLPITGDFRLVEAGPAFTAGVFWTLRERPGRTAFFGTADDRDRYVANQIKRLAALASAKYL